jgi:hypothetical protein
MASKALTELQAISAKIPMRSYVSKVLNRTYYYFPTKPEESEIIRKLRADDTTQASVWTATFCIKALDSSGKQIFTPEDYPGLMALKLQTEYGRFFEETDKVTSVGDAVEAFTGTPA